MVGHRVPQQGRYCVQQQMSIIEYICRCGGIGRHKGLKIPRSKIRTGSIPVSGTKTREMHLHLPCFDIVERNRTHLNATRTSVAGDGLTEPNLYFLSPAKENVNRFRGAMGAPPVAESSDLSEWPRSADDEAGLSARKLPGTATGQRHKPLPYFGAADLNSIKNATRSRN